MKLTVAFAIAFLLPLIGVNAQTEPTADPLQRATPATTTPQPPPAPVKVASTPRQTTTTTPQTTTTTTTTSTEPPQTGADAPLSQAKPPTGAQCPQWHEQALAAGWTVDLLPRLGVIMWRESRCLPEVHNTDDPNSGSRGLTQINGFWCRTNSLNPHPAGWLGAQGVLDSCDNLFNPAVNLLAAKAIYDYGVDKHRCGWGPWSTKKSGWCSKG